MGVIRRPWSSRGSAGARRWGTSVATKLSFTLMLAATTKSPDGVTAIPDAPVAAVPVVAALVASLIHPALWRKFHAGAVGPYAVTPEAWDEILAAAD